MSVMKYFSLLQMLNHLKLPKLTSILLMMGFCFIEAAHSNYLSRHAEGWHFYEDRAVKAEEKEQEKHAQPSPAGKPAEAAPKTPTEFLNAFKAEITKRLHTALVYPTAENIKAYQEIQKVMLDRSELFSERWAEVVYRNPALDYTVNNPISQVGRHIYHDQQREQRVRQIKSLAKTHGLFFFYRGDCPYCHQFAPIVKRFAETYDWKVLAISADGSKLPEFPEARQDNGAAIKLGIAYFPTLLAVEPQTGEVVPLSYGLSTMDQIEERVRVLVKGERQ